MFKLTKNYQTELTSSAKRTLNHFQNRTILDAIQNAKETEKEIEVKIIKTEYKTFEITVERNGVLAKMEITPRGKVLEARTYFELMA